MSGERSEEAIVSILIPAVGGQGGGVLSEWIVEAALAEGVRVHGTSIPGVAQRTGSTTYYVEIVAGGDEEPVFSLYPVPGALDVLLAAEFLEVGRMIEQGLVAPGRTTVIASTHRLYSIHEKIATGRAIYPQDALREAARRASRRLIAFDALALAREHATEANAVLLGALAGSGVVPVGEAAFRTAIERKGVAVEANLRGFELGLGLARGAGEGSVPAAPRPSLPAVPAALQAEVAALPEAVREIATRAVARLVDYQDVAYARRYLARLRPFLPAAGAPPERVELARVVGRHLALWMTYEDAVRVAELKTRPDRFQRIRAEARAGDGVVVVTEYLKPDLDEIWGVLPDRLVRPLARWAERRWPHGRPTLGQHIRSTTVTGYLRLRMLTWLKPLRPVSFRAREEHERMERWLAAVARCAALDTGLGLEVARAGQLVKGYGDVRRRMTAMHEVVLADVLRAIDAARTQGEEGLRVATALAARLRLLVLQGPEGEAQVAATTAATLARLEAGDAAGALAPLAG